MTNYEKELMQDLITQASNKVELLQKTVIEKDAEIEQLKEEKKQAQIDILNEVKKCSQCDNFFPDGNWHRYVLVSDIDILIKEVEAK